MNAPALATVKGTVRPGTVRLVENGPETYNLLPTRETEFTKELGEFSDTNHWGTPSMLSATMMPLLLPALEYLVAVPRLPMTGGASNHLGGESYDESHESESIRNWGLRSARACPAHYTDVPHLGRGIRPQ